MDVHLEILQGRLKQGKTAEGVDRFKIRLRRFIIGSDPSCHLVCKSRTISGRHCLLLIEDDAVLVRDLDSEVGTFINELPVDGTQLIGDGDKLRIGRLEFKALITVSRPQSPPPEPTPPATPDKSDELSIETVVGSETVDALVTDLLQQEDEALAQPDTPIPPLAIFVQIGLLRPNRQKSSQSDRHARCDRRNETWENCQHRRRSRRTTR